MRFSRTPGAGAAKELATRASARVKYVKDTIAEVIVMNGAKYE